MERRNSDRPVPPPHRFLAPEGSRAFGHIALQHRHNRGPEGRARHAGLTSAGMSQAWFHKWRKRIGHDGVNDGRRWRRPSATCAPATTMARVITADVRAGLVGEREYHRQADS
jgi:hypothetical protein